MEQQVNRVLNAFYKNTSVGMDSIQNVLEKTTDPNLRRELCNQMKFYRKEQTQIRNQMQQQNVQPKEPGTMAKLCSDLTIQMRCLGGADSSQIAKLMVEGTNMGIIQLTQVLHESEQIPDTLRHQAHAFLEKEEAYRDRLKQYL